MAHLRHFDSRDRRPERPLGRGGAGSCGIGAFPLKPQNRGAFEGFNYSDSASLAPLHFRVPQLEQEKEEAAYELIVFGQTHCPWCRKFKKEIEESGRDDIKYQSTIPENCPPAPAIPTIFAKSADKGVVVSVGYKPVNEEFMQELHAEAKKKLNP